MDPIVVDKRIADLNALTDMRCLSGIWHGLVVTSHGDNKEFAMQLHSAVGSIAHLMRTPKARRKLEALVKKELSAGA